MSADATIAFVNALTALLEGREVAAVGYALDFALALVPDGDLTPYLTDAAVRRAKAAKNAADAVKFGVGP